MSGSETNHEGTRRTGNPVPPRPEDGKSLAPTAGRCWPAAFPCIVAHTNIHTLKTHPQYQAAKSGNVLSAWAVVSSLIYPKAMQHIEENYSGAIVASVHALEATGINQLPLAYAYAFEVWCKMKVEIDIIQVNSPCHTGATARHRMLTQPEFAGHVEAGKNYILVDDVVTSGSTFAALAKYIIERNGRVVLCSALALTSSPVCGWSGDLSPQLQTRDQWFKRDDWREIEDTLRHYEIQPELLTNSQMKWCLRFKNPESLRRKLLS